MPSKADLFWRRVHARASALVPESTRDFLRAFDVLRANLTGRQIEEWIAAGAVDRLIAYALTDADFATAFSGYRARIQLVTRDAAAYFGKSIPGVPVKTVGVAFDYLNPRVVDAVRQLDSKIMQTLATDTRQTVRDIIQKGLESGAGPRQTARALRDVLALSPNQLAAVQNYRDAVRFKGGLMSESERAAWIEQGFDKTRRALGYELRDKRFDGITKRGALTPAQVDKMEAAYRSRMVAFNAETNARTATLDAFKLGQELSWKDAKDKGLLGERDVLVKQWKGVMDDRERPEHVALEGETVPIDVPYSNGEMIPGESTYNCRCLSIVYARMA